MQAFYGTSGNGAWTLLIIIVVYFSPIRARQSHDDERAKRERPKPFENAFVSPKNWRVAVMTIDAALVVYAVLFFSGIGAKSSGVVFYAENDFLSRLGEEREEREL